MQINTLKNQAELTSQYRVAKDLGVTPPAIMQAINSGRNIFIVTEGDQVSAFEVKPAFNTDPDISAINNMIDGSA